MSIQRVGQLADLENVADPKLRRSLTVLVLGDSGPLLRSIMTVLTENQYGVCTLPPPESLGSLLKSQNADAVLLDLDYAAATGTELDELLRDVRSDPVIPVVGVCNGNISQKQRLEAIGAGVWDVLEVPLKSAELMAKLDAWIWMMRDLDEMRSGVLLDVESGHYSFAGLMRRLREQAALAQRSGEPLSCVLFGCDPLPEEGTLSRGMEIAGMEFSLLLHDATRDSDIVGRVEPLKFAVLTPQTPPSGALRLAERITSWSASPRRARHDRVTFSAGVAGVDREESRGANVLAHPERLLAAARRAVNTARTAGTAQVAVAWGRMC